MKKIFIFVSLIFIIGSLIVLFSLHKSREYQFVEVKNFDMTEFKWEIEHYPLDKNVGQVNNRNVAIEQSKTLWSDWSKQYGLDDGKTYQDIYKEFIKPSKFEVAYDSKEKCWHVYGIFRPNILGGIPHSIIRENGEVIAVWVDE